MIFLDTETCGLVGPIVLIQYSDSADTGTVHLHEVWKTPVYKTLALIERICNDNVCVFNLSFDWFHINKLYNLLVLVSDKRKPPSITEMSNNSNAQSVSYCLRPRKALDLFLHIRKTEWQSLMDRRDIRIKRVPRSTSIGLCQLLQSKIPLSSIFFHYRPKQQYRWQIEEIEAEPQLVDIVLKFGASSGLKPLCSEIFKKSCLDFPIHKMYWPEEDNYNPYDTRWTKVIKNHIEIWHDDKKARGYAEDDVILLRDLYYYFGSPDPGDVDSELAVCVGAVRWKGYAVNLDAINRRVLENLKFLQWFLKEYRINYNSPVKVRDWLKKDATELEQLAVVNTNEKTLKLLEKIYGNSIHTEGTGSIKAIKTCSDIASKAKAIIECRHRAKENIVLERLARVQRFCPEFKVIGTKSGRMSGGGETVGRRVGGSINPQGIKRDVNYRKLFTLSDNDYATSGGDFKSFEVAITHAACQDRQLGEELASGVSMHGVFGELFYGESYDDIISSKGTNADMYVPAKAAAFGYIYGAHLPKIAETLGIGESDAERGYEELKKRYPNLVSWRERIFKSFCSLQQPNGIGTSIIWNDPPNFIASLLGFRRYFTLENRICKVLFELASRGLRVSDTRRALIKRRDRYQTLQGATQSALYACSFIIQARNMRAAANHVIQSTGAYICKELQRAIWALQPIGIHEWVVQPMNIHDEVVVVHKKGLEDAIEYIALKVCERYKRIVPLVAIDWKKNIETWGDLK